MNATRSILPYVALGLLSALPAAQGPSAKPEAKPTQIQAHPHEAGTRAESAHVHLVLTGLTKDNAAKVKDSLAALSTSAYACEPCKFEQAKSGLCPKCKLALKAVRKPDFAVITPSAESASLELELAPAASVRLSEIESALAHQEVKVDEAKLPLAGRAHLLVEGVKAEAVPALEKALSDAKLFDEVKARFDSDSNEVQVLVQAGATPPTRAKVVAALEGAKAKLGDVVWGPLPKKG